MGLDINGTRCLLYARTLNIDFARTAMIGRQRFYLHEPDLKKNCLDFGYSFGDEQIQVMLNKNGGYAEPFLQCLGANEVHSFDISAHEGSTHLHDMNRDIPQIFKERYTVVLDGGSLEHIFNFPVAIKNCMQMVSVGGHYLGITPANNFMGHGFYQFSPEVYFSVFTAANGFELINVIAFERFRTSPWYVVRSPAQLKSRVTLINEVPVELFIIAKKVKATRIFESTPQQSDYLSIWNETNHSSDESPTSSLQSPSKRISPLAFVMKSIPRPVKELIKGFLGRSSSAFDPRFFQQFDPTENRQSPSQGGVRRME